jgi:DNA-binding protein Fis
MEKMTTQIANKHLLPPSRLNGRMDGYVFGGVETILGDFGTSDSLIPVFWDKESQMWAGMEKGVFVSFPQGGLKGWLPMPTARRPLADVSAAVAEALLASGLKLLYQRLVDEFDTGLCKAVLIATDGNRGKSAAMLGIGSGTVGKWITELGLGQYAKRHYAARKSTETEVCAKEGGVQ